MIKILLKHKLVELAINNLFDNIYNNMNPNQNYLSIKGKDITTKYVGMRVHQITNIIIGTVEAGIYISYSDISIINQLYANDIIIINMDDIDITQLTNPK
jgi:hypothetical protein